MKFDQSLHLSKEECVSGSRYSSLTETSARSSMAGVYEGKSSSDAPSAAASSYMGKVMRLEALQSA